MSKIFVTTLTPAARTIVHDGGGTTDQASYGAWCDPHGWYVSIPTHTRALLALNVGAGGKMRRLYARGKDESFAGVGSWSKWDGQL